VRDGEVIDVAPKPVTVAVHGLEAVAVAIFEKCRVVIIGIIRTRAGGLVTSKPGVDAGLAEALDMSGVGAMKRDGPGSY
jgi:hypothetical protein